MIEIPSNCPCCDSTLVEKNYLLYCMSSSCPAKTEARINNLAKALDIKGLGPSSIAKLELATVPDLFFLTQEAIADKLGSAKNAEKVYNNIQAALKTTLDKLIQSFGVRLVGKSASEKLSLICRTVADISEEACKKSGIGPAATNNILAFIESEYYNDNWDEIPFELTFIEKCPQNSGAIVCITGKLSSVKTKAEAERLLVAKGYQIASTLNKSVNILINESGIESQKTKDARSRGVTIVTNLQDILGE